MKEYFSHDYDAHNDPKLINVLLKLGLEGIGAYWILIEKMYRQDGYLILSQCDFYANAMRTQCDVIKSLIYDFDLFIIDGEKYTSKSVLNRLNERKIKSQKAVASANKRWNNANALQTQCDSNAIKEKKRIEKSIKKRVVKTFEKPTIDEVVSYFIENGFPKALGEKVFNHYDCANWHDVNGKPVLSWKQKVRYWFKEENKITNEPIQYKRQLGAAN